MGRYTNLTWELSRGQKTHGKCVPAFQMPCMILWDIQNNCKKHTFATLEHGVTGVMQQNIYSTLLYTYIVQNLVNIVLYRCH